MTKNGNNFASLLPPFSHSPEVANPILSQESATPMLHLGRAGKGDELPIIQPLTGGSGPARVRGRVKSGYSA